MFAVAIAHVVEVDDEMMVWLWWKCIPEIHKRKENWNVNEIMHIGKRVLYISE